MRCSHAPDKGWTVREELDYAHHVEKSGSSWEYDSGVTCRLTALGLTTRTTSSQAELASFPPSRSSAPE